MTMVDKKHQYLFSGKVLPERASVKTPSFEVKISSTQVGSGTLTTHISYSQVAALFETSVEVTDLLTLKNVIEHTVRVEIDVLGYIVGCGYDVEITQVLNLLDNSSYVFGVGVPVLQTRESIANINSFADVMSLCSDIKGSYLQRCLADLREAIRSPSDSGLFCYRAIESLRQFFLAEHSCKNDKESWECLREQLGVTRADIDYMKVFADPVRHGGSVSIDSSERDKLFLKTWEIVDRFILYARNGYHKQENAQQQESA